MTLTIDVAGIDVSNDEAILKDGDAVTVSASGLGALSNPVRAV